jgi:hypothetical protein
MDMSTFRLAIFLFAAMSAYAQERVSVRILLGITDTAATVWDGSVAAEGASVVALEPWRFEGSDAINGSGWRLSTHMIRLFGGGANPNRQFVANGVIAHLSAGRPDAAVKVTTAQGNFEFSLSEVPYGAIVKRLNGRAYVDRVPPPTRITETPDEEDFPSAAPAKDGSVWMAYSIFRHHPDHDRMRAPLKEPLTDFAKLKAPAGGDQIALRHFAGGSWQDAIAITPAGGDLYRTAVAVDGGGRVWVFWSQNNNGNFDIFASMVERGRAGKPMAISKEPGSDVFPVAATDSKGQVWVAWQGWRRGKAAIFAAMQKGGGFTAPIAVSQSSGNEWNPAIAADNGGRVTIAWDSYRNGNYDIYARTATGGSWGAEFAVAAGPRYEAYPSIAYDGSRRLWVAYEEGGAGWGKDFGAYKTTGVPLFQGRAVRLIGIEPDGRRVSLTADVGPVLPGVPRPRFDNFGSQANAESLDPKPDAAGNRNANQAAPGDPNPRNFLPRITADSSGRIWLAFRSMHPIWWNPIGHVYTEYVTSFDGDRWTHPVFLTHTDNVLDNRPAIVSTQAGQLLVMGSSDDRRQFHRSERAGATNDTQPAPLVDPFENDLYMNEIRLAPAARPAPVAAASGAASPANTNDAAEMAGVKRMRDYRLAGDNLRIARGEFHRHSEISMDGGQDGALLDQWRYILDAGALDWVGCCDHDNGGGREYSWWIEQKLTDVFYTPGVFSPMFNYERSVAYPEGHRNVIFAQRGIRTLPRLPKVNDNAPGKAPDTQMLYAYLKFFGGVVASHTSATGMGTDWRDNDPQLEPVVEIYQGDRQNYEMPGAPRSIEEKDAIGGYRPKGYVNLALEKGYQFAFEASSDHISTHISYSNVLVKDVSREAVLDGLRKRHVYGATDNILAEFRSAGHIMGDVFTSPSKPVFQVNLTGTAPFAKVFVVKDNQYVYSTEPKSANVSFTWRDDAPAAGKTSYYYVRGEQENGEIVWVSPMWITYNGN